MSSRRSPRSHHPVVESLETRQLLSLTVDLRLPGGGKSATVTGTGQVINLEIWATVKGANASLSDEALQIAVGSLLSSNINGGAANGTLKAFNFSPFNSFGSQTGIQKDLDGDGDLDVGTNTSTDGSSFWAARAGGSVNGSAFKVGSATFTVTSLKSTTGQTNLTFRPRTSGGTGALWWEDGNQKQLGTGTYQAGSPVVLKRTGTTTGGSISGTVFKDTDKDNIKDSGESGFSGVTMYLDKDKDGVKDSTEPTATTNSYGTYKFSGLAAGGYRVRQVVPSGWSIGSPSSGYHDVTLTTGQNVTGKNFADRSTTITSGKISGKVWNDTDGDGFLDSGETGRSFVTVYLDKNKNGYKDTGEPSKTTDSYGNYSFTGLSTGSYRVRAIKPSGYRISNPSSGYHDVYVSGNTLSGKNFGFTQRILISGRLWVDSDSDGLKDSTESVLSGWTVYIDKNKNGIFDAGENNVKTDLSGNFSFKSLVSGTYRLRVVQQSGYSRIAPSSGYYDLTLGNGGVATGKNFRFKRL